MSAPAPSCRSSPPAAPSARASSAGADIDEGIERLRGTLTEVGHLPLAETADRVIAQARQDDDRPDDIALLMAARRAPSRGLRR
ncbi:hypothetical protein [Streptomyces sp. NPDC057428]|uniref:hypothetical protein n=1 Tax=Streptomyces sp. NPDC057428 TaxID=3346129 RepID=UPI0036BCF170